MKRQAWVAILALLALFVAPGSASARPVAGTGTITQIGYRIESTEATAGGATVMYFNEMNSLTGLFSGGTASHGDCKIQASGRTTCRADGAFVGTVDGRAGAFYFSKTTDVDPASGAYAGRMTIYGGAADLAGIHGHGSVEGNGPTGTYAVDISGLKPPR